MTRAQLTTPPPPAAARALRWAVYGRVIDNFGDVGVCWRLARDLAARGDAVTLVLDDASALAWMHEAGDAAAAAVAVHPWPGPPAQDADVVVEAFGCDPPDQARAAMRAALAAGRPPVWLNLEYLSAEAYVERSHGLPSPQPDGLPKWFFYPGFTPATGALLRERGLLAARAAWGDDERHRWLATQGVHPRPGERLVSLFGYEQPALPALLQALATEATRPTRVLASPGPSLRQLQALADAGALPAGLRWQPLPWLSQPAYDRLLWSCELNLVRGEDSLVRALWAGAPLLWQAYVQDDGAHHAKALAVLHRQAGAAPLPAPAQAWWRAWNGLPGAEPPARLSDTTPGGAWQRAVATLRDELAALPDLAAQLRAFALARRPALCGPDEGPAC